MFKTISKLLFASTVLSSSVNIQAQSKPQVDIFVIDPQRPFVYLKFDHIGNSEPWTEEDSSLRIWFKLVNNCKATIQVRTFGGLDDALGVMDDVVQDRKLFRIIAERPPEPITLPPPEQVNSGKAELQPESSSVVTPKQPSGYLGEVSSLLQIAPGHEVLFSLPANHVSERCISRFPSPSKFLPATAAELKTWAVSLRCI